MVNKLFPEERLEQLYKIIQEEKKVRVNDVSARFSMSRSTIRTDLEELESRGLIVRTHGGAILRNSALKDNENEKLSHNVELNIRMQEYIEEKRAIGQLAATLVNDGDTLMIDGGSTTKAVAEQLIDKKKLSIVTNSILLMPDLMAIADSAVYITGGIVYKENSVLVGDWSNDFVSHFKTKKSIIGMDGVSIESGLTVADSMVPAVASIKKRMIEASSELIIVCDHSKLGRICLTPVASCESISYLVTDDGADPNMISELKALGVNVLIAKVKNHS